MSARALWTLLAAVLLIGVADRAHAVNAVVPYGYSPWCSGGQTCVPPEAGTVYFGAPQSVCGSDGQVSQCDGGFLFIGAVPAGVPFLCDGGSDPAPHLPKTCFFRADAGSTVSPESAFGIPLAVAIEMVPPTLMFLVVCFLMKVSRRALD